MGAIYPTFRTFLLFFVGYIAITVSVLLFSFTTKGQEITNQSFDILRTTPARSEAVIVAIDDKSLQSLGAWPWNREIFANLTQKLAKSSPRSIVYDVLFLEPRDGDDAFKKALGSISTPVILGAKLENGTYLQSFLAAPNTHAVSAVANVVPDTDGKVRRYGVLDFEGSCLKNISFVAFDIATFKKNPSCITLRHATFRYPETITTYSLTDVLDGTVPPEAFTHKTVFIGSTALDLLDTFVGMHGDKVPGVYVHASMFVSELNRVQDLQLSRFIATFWFLLWGLSIGFLLNSIKNTKWKIILLGMAGIALIIVAALSFQRGAVVPWVLTLITLALIAGYNILLETMLERKKNVYIESLFSKYVHKDVLRELMKTSSMLRFDGERKDMTILFSDLRGFTTISEKMQPEELTKLLNGYFSAMTPCILSEKGTIDKFIGDAIMAFWNAPLPVDGHPTHAVRAALSMERALVAFNETHNANLAMGIGIHRGEVTVGNVGSSERVNYTILGDAVNLASRIEGLTKKYGVTCIVTDTVRDAVQDKDIAFRKLDIITVKGKSEATVLYEAYFKGSKDAAMISEYEKAFALYEKGEFDHASTMFYKLASEGDTPSQTMLDRIPQISSHTTWDGVWHFDEK